MSKEQVVTIVVQELVDCDKGDGGCGGGGISSALTWIHNHHGSTKWVSPPPILERRCIVRLLF